MSVMEFILVAHAILVGLGVAEVLRGLGDLIRSKPINVSWRLLGIATWVLLLLFELWWVMWNIRDREEWLFLEFLLLLLPVVILYLVARISFPSKTEGADLKHYYGQICGAMWLLVACVYISFILLQPVLYGAFNPPLIASQLAIVVPAIAVTKVRVRWLDQIIIIAMLAQVSWRGILLTVGS